MEKVYLVINDTNSVCAVFSTKSKAEDYIAYFEPLSSTKYQLRIDEELVDQSVWN